MQRVVQVPEVYRNKFKSITQSISSKPEQSYLAYEHEYVQQRKLINARVESDRARIEAAWEELGVSEAGRNAFLSALEAERDDELAVFRLAREQVFMYTCICICIIYTPFMYTRPCVFKAWGSVGSI